MNQSFDQEEVQQESDEPSSGVNERIPLTVDGRGLTPLDLIALAAGGEQVSGAMLMPDGLMEQIPAAGGYVAAASSPYDAAREAIPDEPFGGHPWHDANPMTQEMSELAWQQAIAAHQASMQAADPTAGDEPAQSGYDMVSEVAGLLLGGTEGEPQVDLETILRLAGSQMVPTLADSMQRQPGQTLDDLVMLPFAPGPADQAPPGMPMPEPYPPAQPLDDPMNLLNPFMMGPGPGI
jgi:hypothetical protein